MKKEWFVLASEKDISSPEDRFDMLLSFLRSQEKIYEQLDQLRDNEGKRDVRPPQRHARTRTTNSTAQASCVVCGERGKRRKLYYCKKFKALK